MVLDSKILKIKQHFGIYRLDQWGDIHPEWILGIDGVGPVTLQHVRLYLAGQGQTLKDDRTPEYWKQHLGHIKLGAQMHEEDHEAINPFTVLIDAQEKQPFTFQAIRGDAPDYAPLVVPVEWRSLGVAMGDYSIDGYEGQCHIERKSLEDAHGTFLGWGERRDRFDRELKHLAAIDCAAVVVECSLTALLAEVPQWGKRTTEENRKSLHRSVLAWQQDYRVPWHFCDTRRFAEITTFRILERFWRHKQREYRFNLRRESALSEAVADL